MVVDVAHLTLDGVRAAKAGDAQAAAAVAHRARHRLGPLGVRPSTRRLVAETGGVIGIFPVNSGGYHGLTGYVDNIERMIKAVGVDHVGIGTDMDGISPPSFVAFDDYAEWPSVTGALLARGLQSRRRGQGRGRQLPPPLREVAAARDRRLTPEENRDIEDGSGSGSRSPAPTTPASCRWRPAR